MWSEAGAPRREGMTGSIRSLATARSVKSAPPCRQARKLTKPRVLVTYAAEQTEAFHWSLLPWTVPARGLSRSKKVALTNGTRQASMS